MLSHQKSSDDATRRLLQVVVITVKQNLFLPSNDRPIPARVRMILLPKTFEVAGLVGGRFCRERRVGLRRGEGGGCNEG